MLLLDADAAHLALLEVALEAGLDALVAPVADARAALRLAESLVPDAVLLDWDLPEMGGAELRRRLRAARGTARVPIVAMAAARPDAATMVEAGCAAVLRTPFAVAALLGAIRGAVAPRT